MADESSGSLDRMKGQYAALSKKFKLGPHHTTERTAMVLGAFMVVGVMFMMSALWATSQKDKLDLTSTASYVNKFVTSRTAQEGTVDGVYGDGIGTRVMVMMSFQDPDKMPADASDYYVYATGIDGGVGGGPTKIAQPTAGSIYSFPGTGKLGIMLDAPDGFGEQLINLTVRAKKELVDATEISEDDRIKRGYDETFMLHDQWRLVINPVAETVIPADSLATPDPEPRMLFAEMALREDEAKKRRELDEVMGQMKVQLDRIDSYGESMANTSARIGSDEGVRIVPPGLPPEIDGDSITGLSAGELGSMLNATDDPESIPDIAAKTPRARLLDTYEDGHMVNTYELDAEYVMANGFDFDWRSRTLVDGYIADVLPNGVNASDYILARMIDPPTRPAFAEMDWSLTNGMSMADLPRNDAAARPLLNLRSNAINAYAEYWDLKLRYENKLLPELLLMEAELDAMLVNSEVASGTEAVEFRI